MEGIEAGGPGAPGAPPSPLSGAYLLIVLGEPHSSLHRQQILTKVQNGFLSWDKESCHVDLEKELQTLASQSPDGEESKNGERLIQFASENLVTEVLIHPTLNTLTQCVRNLLSSFTRHRHIIHAGYTFTGNGSWIVQDGTFSLADLIDAFQEPDVLRVLRAYENTVSVDVHCAPEGDWSTARMRREPFSKICCVRINPDTSHTPAKNVDEFMAFVGKHLQEANLEQLLEPSDVVGNIRFSHPTLYVFPGGQGDAALFGINGFNMLVDGGFSRRACFWDFTRHLDRLDAVLVTRLNNANCLGMAAVLRRKRQAHVYPQVGHFFCNLQERRQQQSPDTEKEGDSLLVSLADIGQEMVVNCRQLQLKPHVCHRDVNIEPINLYHKVGHGKLDMYVISPGKDSRDLKEFLAKWHANDQALFSGMTKKKGEFQFPLHNLVSICALLVWQPANPSETITRLLFPGSSPQHKIFEGLEKLKHLEFLKHPVCSAKTLSPSSSTVGMATKTATTTPKPKPSAVIDKLLPGEGLNKPTSRTIPSVESVNKQNIVKSATIPVATPVSVLSEAKQKSTQKSTKPKIDKQATFDRPKEKTELDDDKEVDKEKEKEKETEITETDAKAVKVAVDKAATKVEGKSKVEQKSGGVKNVKSKVDSRQSVERSKPADRKPSKTPSVEKKTDSVKSSPTTPKKTIDSKPQKASAARAPSRTRASPTATPAKSTKEENNRKVVESKKTTTATRPSPPSKPPKREVSKPEKRPPRKVQAASPSKTIPKTETSPKKAVSRVGKGKGKKEGLKKDKIDSDKAIVTDSSTVSTPSTADVEIPGLKVSEDFEKSGNEPETDVKVNKEEKKDGEAEEATDDVEKLSDRLEDEGIEKDVESTDKGDISDDVDLKIVKDDILTEKSLDGEEKFIKETVGDVKEGICITTAEKDESEREEEDEILVIEKVELEDSTQEPESLESHDVEEIEDELQKHLRDETESEKKLKKDDVDDVLEEQKGKSDVQVGEEKEDEGAVVDGSLDYDEEEEDGGKIAVGDEEEKEKDSGGEEKKDVEEKKLSTPSSLPLKDQPPQTIDILSPEDKEIIVEEVQGIITSATEFVTKTKLEAKSDEQKSSEVKGFQESGSDKPIPKLDEKKDDSDEMKEKSKDQGDLKYTAAEESQPDEKLSTTVESGATTAPTLPEDERIPLDEIKEGIEEKHVKEETREKEVTNIVQNKVEQPTSLPQIAVAGGRGFETKAQIPRDIVKTPDEVADLPVHEEVDAELYVSEEYPGKEFHHSKEDLLGVCTVKKSTSVKDEKDVDLPKSLKESDLAQFDLKEKDVKSDIDKKEPEAEEKENLIQSSSKALDETKADNLQEKQVPSPVLEEQPIHSTLKAPEVPEYVMLSPDSAPESPLPKDETKGILKYSKICKVIESEEKDVDTADKGLDRLESHAILNESVTDVEEDKEKQKTIDSQKKSSTFQDISKIGVSETIEHEPEASTKPASPELDKNEGGTELLKNTINSKVALIENPDASDKEVEPEIQKKSSSDVLELESNILLGTRTDEKEHEIITKDLILKEEKKHEQLEEKEVKANIPIESEDKIITDQQEKPLLDEGGKVKDGNSTFEAKASKPSSPEPGSRDKSPALLDTKTSASPEPAEEIIKAHSEKSASPVPSESKQSKPVTPEPGFDKSTAVISSNPTSIAKSSKSASPEPTEKGIIEPSEKSISPVSSETKIKSISPEPTGKASPTPSEIRGSAVSPELEKGSREESSLKLSSPPPSEVKDLKAPSPAEKFVEMNEICSKDTISPILSQVSTPKSDTPEPKVIGSQPQKSIDSEHFEEKGSSKSVTPEPIHGTSSAKSVSPVPEGLDFYIELSEKEKKFLPEKSLSPAPSETKLSKPSSPEPTYKEVSSAKSVSPITFEEKLSDKSELTKQYEEALSKFESSELSEQKLSEPSNVESLLKSSIALESEDVKADVSGKIDDRPVSLEERTSPKSASPEPTSKTASVKSVSPTPIESKTSRSITPEKDSKAPSEKLISPAPSKQTCKFDDIESVMDYEKLGITKEHINTDLETKASSTELNATAPESKELKPASPEPTEKAVTSTKPLTFEIKELKTADLESFGKDKKLPSEKSVSPVPSDDITLQRSTSPEQKGELQADKTVTSAESGAKISKPPSPELADDKLFSKSISNVASELEASKSASPEPANESPLAKSVSSAPLDSKTSKPASPEPADKLPTAKSSSPDPSESKTSKPASPEPADNLPTAKSASPTPSDTKTSKPGSPEPADKSSTVKSDSPAPSQIKTSKPASPEPTDKSSEKSVSPAASEVKISRHGSPEPTDKLPIAKSASPTPSDTKTSKPGSPEPADKSSTVKSDSPAPSQIKTSKPASPEPTDKSSEKSVSPVPSEVKITEPGSPEPADKSPIAISASPTPSDTKTSKPASPEPADKPPSAKSMSPAPSEIKSSKPGSPEPADKSATAKLDDPAPSDIKTSTPASPEPADKPPSAKSLSPAPSEIKSSKPGSPEPADKSATAKLDDPAPSDIKTSTPGSTEPADKSITAKSVSPAPSEIKTSKPVSPEPKTSKPASPEPADASTPKPVSPALAEIESSKPGMPEPSDKSVTAKSASPVPSESKMSKPGSPELKTPTSVTPEPEDKSPSAKSVSTAPSNIKTSKPGSPEPKTSVPGTPEPKISKAGTPEPADKSPTANSVSPAPSDIETPKPRSPEPADESPLTKSVSPAISDIKKSKPGSPEPKKSMPGTPEPKISKPGTPEPADKSPTPKSESPAPSNIKTPKPGSPEPADKPLTKSVSPAPSDIKSSKPGSPEPKTSKSASPEPEDKIPSAKSMSPAPSDIKSSKPGSPEPKTSMSASPEPEDKIPSAKSMSPASLDIKTSKPGSPEPADKPLTKSVSPAPSDIKSSKPGSPEPKTSKSASPEPEDKIPSAKSMSPAPLDIKTSKPGTPEPVDKSSSAKSVFPAPSDIKTSKPGSPEPKTSKSASSEPEDKIPSAKSMSPAPLDIKTTKPASPEPVDKSSAKSGSPAPSEVKLSKPGSPEPADKFSVKSVSPTPSEVNISKPGSPEPANKSPIAKSGSPVPLESKTSKPASPELADKSPIGKSAGAAPLECKTSKPASPEPADKSPSAKSVSPAPRDVKTSKPGSPDFKDLEESKSRMIEELANKTFSSVSTEDKLETSPKSKYGEKDDMKSFESSSSPSPIGHVFCGVQDTSSLIGETASDDEGFSSTVLLKDSTMLGDKPSFISTDSILSDSKVGVGEIVVSKVQLDMKAADSCPIQKISETSQQKVVGAVETSSDLDKILSESDRKGIDKGGKTEEEVEDLSMLDKASSLLGKISPKSVSPISSEIDAKIGLGDDYNKIKPLASSASDTPRSISPLPSHDLNFRKDGAGKSDFMISSSSVGKDIYLKDTKIDDVRPFSTDKTDDMQSTLKLKGDAGFLGNEINGKFDSLESYSSIEPQKSVKTALEESSVSSILSSKEDYLKSISPVPNLKETIDKRDSLTDSKVSSKSVSPAPSEVDSKMEDWMKSPSLGRKDLDSKVSSAFGSKTETPQSISPVPSEKLDLKSVSTPPPSPITLESSSKKICELASKATPPKSPVSKDPIITVLDNEILTEKVSSNQSTSSIPHDISSIETSSIASSIPITQMTSSVNGFSSIDSGIKSSFTDGKDSSLDSSISLTKSAIVDNIALPITDKSGITKVLTETTLSSIPSTLSDLKTISDSCVPSDSILESKDAKAVESATDSSKVCTSPLQSESQLVSGKVDTSKVSSPFSSKEETSKDDSKKTDLLVGLDKIISDSVKGIESVVSSTVDSVMSTKTDDLSQPTPSDSTTTKLDDESQDDSSKKVHRMVVTASSEDGGSETELCAGGSISFTPSTDTSDKMSLKDSSNEVSSKEISEKLSSMKDDSFSNGVSSESQILTKTLGSKDGEVTTLTTVIKPSVVKEEVIEKSMTESPEKSSAKKVFVEEVSAKKGESDKKGVAEKLLTGDSKFLGGIVSELKKEAFDITRSGTPGSETDFDGGRSTPRSDISSGQASRALTGSEEHLDSRSSPDSPGSPCLGSFGGMTGSIIGSFKPYAMQFGGGDDYRISQILDDDDDEDEDEHFKGSRVESKSDCLRQVKVDEKITSKDTDVKQVNGQSTAVSGTGKVGEPFVTSEQSKLVQEKEKDPKSGAAASSSSAGPSAADLSSDPIKGWGKPLGLPPPPEEKNRWFPTWDPIEEWGKPLGLPTPAPPLVKKDSSDDIETSASNKTTPKKVAKRNAENNKSASNTTIGKEANTKSKRPESPNKRGANKENKKAGAHIYVDLSYVPHNGNSHYTNVEFFKRVRARYYVFSGTEPSREVFNALLEAKQTWEDKDLEVTIIPTYDTDVLGYWVAENEEVLAKNKIDLSPSASRCTINLQDHETSCSAYRLEF